MFENGYNFNFKQKETQKKDSGVHIKSHLKHENKIHFCEIFKYKCYLMQFENELLYISSISSGMMGKSGMAVRNNYK